jgi:hypothetical protein
MAKNIDLDFKKWFDQIADYFSHLTMDMQIAWAVLGLGVILVIIGIVMM